MSISANRVLHETSPGLNPVKPRSDLVRLLKEMSQKRTGLSRELQLIELWELLEGEGEEFSYNFLAELFWPKPINSDQVAAAFRCVFADGVYFKLRPDKAVRHSQEKVDQIIKTRQREAEKEKELSEGAVWLAQVWQNGYGREPVNRDRMIKSLHEVAVHGAEAPEYKWIQKMIDKAGLGANPWRPFQLLVKMGEMNLHENLELLREGLATTFSAQALIEAENMARCQVWRDQPRRDLTDLMVITADSGGAKDFDDAVSLEVRDNRFFLGVHIADVSAVIKPGSVLDREAMDRTTSIYTPDRRIPMLPEILSDECLSLKEGEVRPAFTMLAELTGDGQVEDYDFFPSLIKVKRQLSYQEVDGTYNQDLVLNRMFELSQALKSRRLAGGALILPLPKLNVYITPEGEIGINLTIWENPGRSMISEFMILANHLAAKYLLDRNLPCYYRSQDKPSKITVPPDTNCEDLYPCLRQKRFLSRVNWGLEPLPHCGMGLEVYTNLTSPLRRYVDLVIQRQIRADLETDRHFYSTDGLKEMLTLIETTRRKAMRLQNNRRRYWLLRYMENQSDRVFETLVLEKHPHRYHIFLLDLMLDADLPVRPGRNLEPGETINVKIKKINAREDVLKFELV